MTTDMSTALALLATGMLTVFAVLALVVASGYLLIRLVNRWAPLPAPARPDSPIAQPESLPPATLAALTAAVAAATQGRGQIVDVTSTPRSTN